MGYLSGSTEDVEPGALEEPSDKDTLDLKRKLKYGLPTKLVGLHCSECKRSRLIAFGPYSKGANAKLRVSL